MSHPFLEGRFAPAGGRSPGFGLWAAPSRGAGGVSVADVSHAAPSTPGHSGGTAPDSHRTSLDHRPIWTAEAYPRGQPTEKAPLDWRPEPPSSRGLGRRPLTAETGVRIPVAVLKEALRIGGTARRAGRSSPV